MVEEIRRRRPTKKRATARREILAGAAHLFRQQGYHATSVREIGDYLGISQSSLYYHATNKPQILVDLNEEFMSDVLEAFRAIEATDSTPFEKMHAVFRELLRAVAENTEVVAVVLHERRSLPPDAVESIQQKRDDVDKIIDGILNAGIADGSIRPVNVQIARLGLTGMTNWAYTWYRPGGGSSYEELADQFWDILMHGLKA